MSLSGPTPVRALEGLATDVSRRDRSKLQIHLDGYSEQSDDTILISINERVSVKLNPSDPTSGLRTAWFAPSFLPFTSQVLWDNGLQNYAVILKNNHLIIWNGEETKLEKIQAIVLKANVFDLCLVDNATAEHDSDIYVVFECGDVQPLSFIHKNPNFTPEDTNLSPKRRLKECKLFIWQNNMYVTQRWFEENPTKNTFVTFQLRIDPDSNAVQKSNSNTIEEQKNCQTMGVVFYNGASYALSLNAENIMEASVIGGKAGLTKRRLMKLDSGLNVKGEKALLAHQAGQDVIVAAFERKNRKCSEMKLISLRFFTCLASVSLEEKCEDIALWRNKLYVKLDQEIVQMTINDLPQSLDGMVGRDTKYQQENELQFDIQSNGFDDKIEFCNESNVVMDFYNKVPKLLASEDVKGIEVILDSQAEDLPEILVLSIIEFLIQTTKVMSQVHREKLLIKAFQVPFTEPLMRQFVTKADLSIVFKMLEFLHLAVTLDSASVSKSFDSYIDWIAVLLSSHYSEIMITKDEASLELFKKLNDILTLYERECFSFASMLPLFQLMRSKNFPEQSKFETKAYSIEVINL